MNNVSKSSEALLLSRYLERFSFIERKASGLKLSDYTNANLSSLNEFLRNCRQLMADFEGSFGPGPAKSYIVKLGAIAQEVNINLIASQLNYSDAKNWMPEIRSDFKSNNIKQEVNLKVKASERNSSESTPDTGNSIKNMYNVSSCSGSPDGRLLMARYIDRFFPLVKEAERLLFDDAYADLSSLNELSKNCSQLMVEFERNFGPELPESYVVKLGAIIQEVNLKIKASERNPSVGTPDTGNSFINWISKIRAEQTARNVSAEALLEKNYRLIEQSFNTKICNLLSCLGEFYYSLELLDHESRIKHTDKAVFVKKFIETSFRQKIESELLAELDMYMYSVITECECIDDEYGNEITKLVERISCLFYFASVLKLKYIGVTDILEIKDTIRKIELGKNLRPYENEHLAKIINPDFKLFEQF